MSYIEKERLIRADIESIENRVRHAFNQGYDLGYKEGKERAKPQEQEPTTRNCFGCQYSKDNHNAGTEKCHLCMWENQYTPTAKKDLGVDCISRQAVEDAVYDATRAMDLNYGQIMEYIDNLPSVTPQARKGHWISRWYAGHDFHFHVCSECNEEFSCDMETGISIDNYRYCPNCGCRMDEPQESEDDK